MKKHTAGFIFFVFIVAVFAGFYALFRTFPVPDIGAVELPDESPTILVDGNRSIRVTQAIADPLKRTLAFTLADGDSGLTEVELAFYNIGSDGIRFVRSEVVKLPPNRWTSGATSGIIRFKTDWLGSKQVTDNLYVVAVRRSESRSKDLAPFSRDRATAVLIAKN